MKAKIIGVDPGKTTGLAVWAGTIHPGQSIWTSLGNGAWYRKEITSTSLNEVERAYEICVKIGSYARSIRAIVDQTIVVIERWTPSGSEGGHNTVADQVGWYLAGMINRMYDIRFQRPGEAMALATDDRIKSIDAWMRGKPHAMDATRHVALAVAKLQKELKEKR